MDFTNATISIQEDRFPPVDKRENAKVILENIDAILKELTAELVRIDNVIYAPRPCGENAKNEPIDECLLGTLSRQRETAQSLLDLAIHIREGLV